MTNTIEQIAARHYQADVPHLNFCNECEKDWPCDAARLAALLTPEALAAALHDSMGTHSRPFPTRQICPGPSYHDKEAAAILAALEQQP